MAKLQLYHPTKPSADAFVRLVEEDDARVSEAAFDRTRKEARSRLADTYLRAAFILRLQGRRADANMGKDIVERKCPGMWYGGNILRATCGRDPKMQGLLKASRARGGGDEDD